MKRLDPSLWAGRPGFPKLLAALNTAEGETRLVGGAVRDLLLGDAVADVDLATRLEPQQVVAELTAAEIRAAPDQGGS